MARPLYDQGLTEAARQNDGHLGLWNDRYFDAYPSDWIPYRDAHSKAAWANGKTEWLKKIASYKAGSRTDLAAATCRLSDLAQTLGGDIRVHRGTWHFATGLGLPHPLENGLLWHPTLGVPYLPGAAVKGLVRAWMESWIDYPDEATRHATLRRWFGTEDKDPVQRRILREHRPAETTLPDSEAGAFFFFDALPLEPVKLKADVMTPHMGGWYEKGGDAQQSSNPDVVPADWHDPVPVQFLVADQPLLLFAVAPRGPEYQCEVKAVLDALSLALETLGAGAKTAVGYGVMSRQASDEDVFRQRYQDHVKARQEREEQHRKQAEYQAELDKFPPLQREIRVYLDERPDRQQSEISALITALKQDRWQGEEKRQVAQHVEALMQASPGQWREKSEKKNPDKDREYQNTQRVKEWLEGK